MEIIEKIQLVFGDDLDDERLVSISRTCVEMLAPIQMDLAFYGKDQKKLKHIQSKQKEAKEKIKEIGIRAHYALDLYNQHLNIELKKFSNGQAFNIPLMLNATSIFKEKIDRIQDFVDEYNEMDHVECALTNAQKVCEESIVWSIFFSELEELNTEINESMTVMQKQDFPENPSSEKEHTEEIKIESWEETPLSKKETILPSRFLQIFKEGGAELFDYFQSEYTLDDHWPVAKYSYIYHFLVYEQLIITRSQLKYMEFIKDSYGVNMSKILPENDKFNDDIQPLLSRLKSNFERKSKSELNRN